MDRRAFCVSSASSALALAALGATAATRLVPGAAPTPFEKILIDSRFAAGRAFGAAAARSGASVASFQGDLTDVWVDQLRPYWTGAGGPIAGLTTMAGLFCLEQLAKDHWLRVVARTRVDAAPGRGVAGWSEGLLSSLAARRPEESVRVRREPTRAAAELVAWVIAKSSSKDSRS